MVMMGAVASKAGAVELDNNRPWIVGGQLGLPLSGARACWHWAKHAPLGGYLFADVAYVDGKFSTNPGAPIVEEKRSAIQPLFGAGCQFMTFSRITLDLGFGVGPKVQFKQRTANGGGASASSNAELYIGLGFNF
jgi:hypothetical protein